MMVNYFTFAQKDLNFFSKKARKIAPGFEPGTFSLADLVL